jgi:hypothetical protein
VPVALTLQCAPAVAQEQARTQSVEIFGGEQFGDNLTDGPVSGRTPRLNDDADDDRETAPARTEARQAVPWPADDSSSDIVSRAD